MTQAHQPVMLHEVLDGLSIRPDGCYVDATFGRGGHSAAILEQLDERGRLVALDRDAAAVAAAAERFDDEPRFSIVHAPFSMIANVLGQIGVRADGLLFDFGVSSPQLDEADRGFSFLRDGPLDMRMDAAQSLTAAAYIADIDEVGLRRDIARLGEERLAARIARAIVQARGKAPITRTLQLADIIEAATPARVRAKTQKHPATRTFQAIRMRINDELGEITQALSAVVDVLAIGGRVCFLTFHSLEDRPVKHFLRDQAAEDPVYRGLPDVPVHARPSMRIVGKARVAGEQELGSNPRARSARLRVAERLQ